MGEMAGCFVAGTEEREAGDIYIAVSYTCNIFRGIQRGRIHAHCGAVNKIDSSNPDF